jgi:hypothetical protein
MRAVKRAQDVTRRPRFSSSGGRPGPPR